MLSALILGASVGAVVLGAALAVGSDYENGRSGRLIVGIVLICAGLVGAYAMIGA